MTESKRYSDRTPLTGRLRGQVRDALQNCFNTAKAVEDFVEQNFGRSVLHSINWNQPLTYAIGELVSDRQRQSGIGELIGYAQKAFPNNTEFNELVTYLVEAGYFNDSEAPVAPRNRLSDWVAKYPSDLVGCDAPNKAILVEELAKLYTSVAAFDRMLGDCFTDDYSRKIRNDLDRKQTVAANISRAWTEFENLGRMNAFIMAMQHDFQSNMLLMYFAANILQQNRPKPAPAPVTVTPALVPAAPPPVPAVKAFRVAKVVKQLDAAQLKALTNMIVSCFGQNDLEVAVHIGTGERLDHIVANGPLKKVVSDLLRWCTEDNDKLPPLLNRMMRDRPGRADLKEHIEKLVTDGVLEAE